jgi:hypothetical protein
MNERLWKIRTIFDNLSDSYSKYYSLTEQLALDEIIVLYKGWVIFKQYITNKQRELGINICKLCDSKEYTYDKRV